MRIVVTGGSGHLGWYVLRHLVERGDEITCLVRRGSRDRLRGVWNRLRVVEADLGRTGRWTEVLAGADCLVHLVGILNEDRAQGNTYERVHVELAGRVIDAAVAGKVGHVVWMSSLLKPPFAGDKYLATKRRGEQLLINSGLSHTIFRPLVITGEQMERSGRELPIRLTSLIALIPTKGEMKPIRGEVMAAAIAAGASNPAACQGIRRAPDIVRFSSEEWGK